MHLKKRNINNAFLFIGIFLTFFGFYSVLLVLANVGMSEVSRVVTVPLRIVICLSFFMLHLLNFRNIVLNRTGKLFLLFSAIYIFRIAYDYYRGEPYYLGTSEHLMYYFSFAFIPFFTLHNFSLDPGKFHTLFKALYISGVIFSVLSVLFYKDFVGEVGRLTMGVAGGEGIVSPLILSYCSALIVGIILAYLFFNRTRKFQRVLMYVTIGLCTVPFFLGASRGSLFALVVPIFGLFIARARVNLKSGIKLALLIASLIMGMLFIESSFESGLLERFTGILDGIQSGESAARLMIWESSIHQFINHPFIGDKLRVDNWEGYPHNLFLEVLQTMGIAGATIFLVLVVKAVNICFNTFRYYSQYSWIPVIFLQALIQHMFSGAIYTAAWFWTSLALLYSLDIYLKKKTAVERIKVTHD